MVWSDLIDHIVHRTQTQPDPKQLCRVEGGLVCARLTSMVPHAPSCLVRRVGSAPGSTPDGSLWGGGASRGPGLRTCRLWPIHQ